MHTIDSSLQFQYSLQYYCVEIFLSRISPLFIHEQFLIEEIYERELAQQDDTDSIESERDDECSDESYLEREGLLESKQNYGSIRSIVVN